MQTLIDFIMSNFQTLFVSTVGSFIAGLLFQKWLDEKKRRPLRQILNFNDRPLVFVLSHRKSISSFIPPTSTEDFLAMNNFISALVAVKWHGKYSYKDTTKVQDVDYNKNIVSICSKKSNSFSKKVEETILAMGIQCYYFDCDSETGFWHIRRGQGTWESSTYHQIDELVKKGVDENDLPRYEFDDMAVITKIDNPFHSQNKVFMVAGVRGIGSWGAAECLKKEWRQIYDKLPKDKKSSNFSALVSIKYKDYDIVDIRVDNVVELPSLRDISPDIRFNSDSNN